MWDGEEKHEVKIEKLLSKLCGDDNVYYKSKNFLSRKIFDNVTCCGIDEAITHFFL